MSKPKVTVVSRKYAFADTVWIIHNRGNANLYCSCRVCAQKKNPDERRSPLCPDFAAKGEFAIYHPGFGWNDDHCVRGSVCATFAEAKAKMETLWRHSICESEAYHYRQAKECQSTRALLDAGGAEAFAWPPRSKR